MLNQEQLKRHLYYDRVRGDFYWRNPLQRSCSKPWDKAGSLGKKGYIKIVIAGKTYEAHRLAWMYVHGRFPAECMDHKNGVKNDNRLENLREATKSQNNFNVGRYSNNQSGIKGVHWVNASKKWRAEISAHGKRVDLGMFGSIDDAKSAIDVARIDLHGEFAYCAAQAAKQGEKQ